MSRRTLRALLVCFALVNLALLGIGFRMRNAPPILRVTFLDVGQGDAAVIETPSGKVMVMDTGNVAPEGGDVDMGRRVLVPFLRSRGIQRIDVLALSHPHGDHIGGAKTLLETFPVGLLLDNGQERDSPLVFAIHRAAQQRRTLYRMAKAGQTLDFGDGTLGEILAPTEAQRLGKVNDASLVLRLTFGRTAFLFTGDAEEEEERALVQQGANLACDVLKAAHHGSETSTTPEFLAAARPKAAVLSVGRENVYGHPGRRVLERLKTQGCAVYRTDRQGAIVCLSDGVAVDFRPTQ